MCTTFFKFFKHHNNTEKSDLKFAIAFNRDISFLRATNRVSYWCEDHNLLGGQDLVRGGSWFLLNIKTGNIAFLTNIWVGLGPHGPKRSRGEVIKNFVRSDFFENRKELNYENCAEIYLEEIKEKRESYMPFNLVVGNIKAQNMKLVHFDSKSGNIIQFDSDKFYGLSNSAINEPYKKIEANLEKLNNNFNEIKNLDEMFKLFKDVMNDDYNQGIEDKEEEASVRVKPYYCLHTEQQIRGTQSQIILLVDFDDNYMLEEVFYEPEFVVRKMDFGAGEREKKLRKIRKAVLVYMGILRMRKTGTFKIKTFKSLYEGEIG